MNNTLESIWGRACSEPIGPWDDLWALAQAGGVPVKHLMGLGALDIGIKDGRWEERFRGDRAIIVPAVDLDGDLHDLVAFRLTTPRSFWPMTGQTKVLGNDNLDRASSCGEPLMIHECPLDWLKAKRQGIVILDWKQYWPLYLSGIPALRCASVEFGRRLQSALQRPFEIPEILVAA